MLQIDEFINMSYPGLEYDDMRESKLYPKEHIRNIYRQRKIFDNKIAVISPLLNDFLEYIKFEKVILFDFNNRINMEKVKEESVRNIEREKKVEEHILNKIKIIYTKTTIVFPKDFEIWLAFHNFCREHNIQDAMSNIVDKMLLNFHENPVSWNIAVAWFKSKSLDEGINLVLRGLDIHPTFENLYSHAVKLKVMKLKLDLTDESKAKVLASLKSYVKMMCQNIRNPKFICRILKKLEPAKITRDVQNMVIEFLLENWPDETYVWQILADREANGFHYQIEENVTSTDIYRVNKSLEKYQEGIEIVSRDKKQELWISLFNFLLDLRSQDTFKSFANEKLGLGFAEAHKTIVIPQHYYLEWYNLLQDEVAAELVLKKGLNEHPQSVDLWKQYLQMSCLRDNKVEFNQRFQRAVAELENNSLQVWIMALSYHGLTSDRKVVENIYKEAIKQPEPISNVIKPLYIEFLMNYSSLRFVRKVYDTISVQEPYCKQLHKAMIRIEHLEMEKDLVRIERMYELAAKQFADEDIKVRLSMITFYVNNSKGFKKLNPSFDLQKMVEETYNKGLDALKDKPLLLSEYKAAYEKLNKS